MPQNKTIQALLEGKADNHILPFFWQHGEDEATLRQMMQAIDGANCKAVCVESRPHPDFCGAKWWEDMDVILDEARRRGMQVWILDDSHFPTGFANGAVKTAPDALCRQSILGNSQVLDGEVTSLTLNLREAGLLDPPKLNMQDPMQAFASRIPPARTFDPDTDVLLTVQAVAADGTTIDLRDCVKDMVLTWDKPEGVYILQVVAASRNAGYHRDYINMTDPASVQLLIDAVYEPHWAHYAEDFGKTIAGFFSDEPELGNGLLYQKGNILGCGQDLPWSEPLAESLKTAFGAGLEAALPRLFMQDESDETARIHTLYMDCLTKLVRQNFSEALASWCHKHGVQYIGHIIEDDGQHCRTGSSLGHYFRALQGQDMAGIDDIGGQVLPQCEDGPALNNMHQPRNGEFYHYGLATLAESAAAIEPKKQGNAMCEIFGNYGWAEGVHLEKYLADHFLVRGINWFVPHAFSGKEFPDPDCPPHFYAHGHNPQYRHFGQLMAYMNRVATLTSSGRHTAQVAVLYHGEAEWCDPEAMPFEHALRPLYDDQIFCRVVPSDIFAETERYNTVLGNPLQVNGQEYQAFVVPASRRLSTSAAAGLVALVQAGLPVFFAGGRPVALCEGGELPAVLADCPVVELDALPQTLRAAGVVTPVLEPKNNRLRLLTVEGDTTSVFVVNEAKTRYSGVLKLPGFKGDCYWYNPWDNRCEPAQVVDGEELQVQLTVEPLKSCILVMGQPPAGAKLYTQPQMVGQVALGDWSRSTCEGASYPNFGQATVVTLPDALAEEQPEFSGFVRYETSFQLQADAPLVLEISDAAEGVEVFLNGESAGIQIAAPYIYELDGKAGENHLVIEVATTLERQCYPLLDGYRKMMATVPTSGSGLTGKVTLRHG